MTVFALRGGAHAHLAAFRLYDGVHQWRPAHWTDQILLLQPSVQTAVVIGVVDRLTLRRSGRLGAQNLLNAYGAQFDLDFAPRPLHLPISPI